MISCAMAVSIIVISLTLKPLHLTYLLISHMRLPIQPLTLQRAFKQAPVSTKPIRSPISHVLPVRIMSTSMLAGGAGKETSINMTPQVRAISTLRTLTSKLLPGYHSMSSRRRSLAASSMLAISYIPIPYHAVIFTNPCSSSPAVHLLKNFNCGMTTARSKILLPRP